MFWPYVAIGLGAAYALVIFTRAYVNRAPGMGWVSAAFLVLNAAFNSAAPLRGVLDPHYAGYHYGLLEADRGLVVTAIALPLVAAFLLGAWIVTAARIDRAHLIAAAILLLAGANTLLATVFESEAAMFQLGEFLRLEGAAAKLAILALTSLPLLVGGVWALVVAARRDTNPPAAT